MSPHDGQQFHRLYQIYRYEDQLNFYKARRVEFTKAQSQAITISIGLILLAAVAGGLESINVPWLKLTCLLVAAISPLLSTTLAAYSVLYAFEQQAKLYQDTGYNLLLAQTLAPDVQQGLNDADFTEQLGKYVHEIENIFLVEQGQWGQLAKKMKPPEV